MWSTLELAGGKVAADGRVVLGSPVRYTVTRGTLEGVGIPEGDSLNARFTLRGAGVEPSSMAAQGRVDLLSSTIAGRRIDSLRTDLMLRNGRLDVRGRGMVEETAVSIEADARPFEQRSSVRVRRAELRSIELQRLFPALGLTTHADVIASGTLVGGIATIEADVRDSSGRITLAATARPLDSGTEPGAARGRAGGREPRPASQRSEVRDQTPRQPDRERAGNRHGRRRGNRHARPRRFRGARQVPRARGVRTWRSTKGGSGSSHRPPSMPIVSR